MVAALRPVNSVPENIQRQDDGQSALAGVVSLHGSTGRSARTVLLAAGLALAWPAGVGAQVGSTSVSDVASLEDRELGEPYEENGERVIYVNADMEQESISDITTTINEQFLPDLQDSYPGLSVLKGGSQEEEEEFFDEIFALYAVAFFLMYTLIAIAFHSYWLPLLIMTAIPFGFMGAVFGHLIFDLPMALFPYFGIGAAAGVVVNDNLVLVDYMRRLRNEGREIMEAVVEAGVNRFRPILLTTVTTFVGLIPIMSERSTDAQFLKPAVLSLAFGVLFALFVSLLMVPALYVIGDDCARGVARLRARLLPGRSGRSTAAPADAQS